MTQQEKDELLVLLNSGIMSLGDINIADAELNKEGETIAKTGNGVYTIEKISSPSTPSNANPAPALVVPSTDPYYQIMVLLREIVDNSNAKGSLDADEVKGIIKKYLNQMYS